MIQVSEHRRCRAIADQVVTAYGRDQVSKALYEAILVGLNLGPCDIPLAEDRDWIRRAIAVPIHEATDAALDVLKSSLGRALEQAPTGLLDRFEHGHLRSGLGLE
jgi:hypothetical protein